MKSNVTDVEVRLHHETEKAVLVSDTGIKADAVWLPKSQIEICPSVVIEGEYTVTLPDWLAEDKGLV